MEYASFFLFFWGKKGKKKDFFYFFLSFFFPLSSFVFLFFCFFVCFFFGGGVELGHRRFSPSWHFPHKCRRYSRVPSAAFRASPYPCPQIQFRGVQRARRPARDSGGASSRWSGRSGLRLEGSCLPLVAANTLALVHYFWLFKWFFCIFLRPLPSFESLKQYFCGVKRKIKWYYGKKYC